MSAFSHELADRGGPVEVRSSGPSQTRLLGRRLAGLLEAGDVVVLSGDLGSGKTILAQGIGIGLGVRGHVTSPTFVISRVHPSETAGPALVHVDAYRLRDGAELDDLDLEETLTEAVTVVEWGDGIAEALSPDRLRVRLRRRRGENGGDGPLGTQLTESDGLDELRMITVEGIGDRWSSVPLSQVLDPELG